MDFLRPLHHSIVDVYKRQVCAHPLDRLAVRGQMGGLKQEFGQPRPGDRAGVLFPAWGPPGQDRNQRPGGQQAAQGRFPPVHGIVSLRLIGICVGLCPLHKTKVFPKRNGFWGNCGNIMK